MGPFDIAGAITDAGSLVARVTGTDGCEDCATGLVAALCNLGVLAEMAGDTPGARAGFERALARARGPNDESNALKRHTRRRPPGPTCKRFAICTTICAPSVHHLCASRGRSPLLATAGRLLTLAELTMN